MSNKDNLKPANTGTVGKTTQTPQGTEKTVRLPHPKTATTEIPTRR